MQSPYRALHCLTALNLHRRVSPKKAQVFNQYRSLSTQTPVAFSVIDTIQEGLVQFQTMTNLPWWAVLASSTIMVKLAMFPLVRYQLISSDKLSGIKLIYYATTILAQTN